MRLAHWAVSGRTSKIQRCQLLLGHPVQPRCQKCGESKTITEAKFSTYERASISLPPLSIQHQKVSSILIISSRGERSVGLPLRTLSRCSRVVIFWRWHYYNILLFCHGLSWLLSKMRTRQKPKQNWRDANEANDWVVAINSHKHAHAHHSQLCKRGGRERGERKRRWIDAFPIQTIPDTDGHTSVSQKKNFSSPLPGLPAPQGPPPPHKKWTVRPLPFSFWTDKCLI